MEIKTIYGAVIFRIYVFFFSVDFFDLVTIFEFVVELQKSSS